MTILYPGFMTQHYAVKDLIAQSSAFPNQNGVANQIYVVLDCPTMPLDQDVLMPLDQFTQAIQKEGFMPPYQIQMTPDINNQPSNTKASQ